MQRGGMSRLVNNFGDNREPRPSSPGERRLTTDDAPGLRPTGLVDDARLPGIPM